MSAFRSYGAVRRARWLCAALFPLAAGAEAIGAPRSGALEAQWRSALQLEEEAVVIERDDPQAAAARYVAAARRFEGLAREGNGPPTALWRSARCAWLAGDALPRDAVEGRVRSFTRAKELAARGLERDPECAECMLWLFASMGRLRTTLGIWEGIGQVPEMAALLDRAIALQPTYSDNEWNSTLGNLYYSSAIFYRVLPDWFWLKWFLGVRGDKARALGNIRAALALHPTRLDYEIELGSQLLCWGTSSRGQETRLQAGREILERALLAEPQTRDETRHLEAARIMLREPAKACGYTGDAWVEISESEAREAES